MSSSRPAGWEQLGDYKLLGKFAEGQSCVLRLATHRGAGEHAGALRAVKMPQTTYVDDPGFANLLVSEAQLLACIQHPNVVAAHGFGRERGGYVTLDYVEGDDFKSLQAVSRTPPDPRVTAAIIADILHGLDAVHEAIGEVGDPLRAVHQAPHARHILISTDGRARLCDFTHARVQRPTSERRRQSRLDPAYRAPEQVLTPDQVDSRTDLFVLGIALWEALAGQSLFGAPSVEQTSKNILSTPIPRPGQISGQAHSGLDRVCMRALERDPEARWPSAKDMLAALLDAALDLGGIALPAQVARWVVVQGAATLQARRALLGGQPTEPVEAPKTIPPVSAAALGATPTSGGSVRPQPLDVSKPFDHSKTLMGTGLNGQRPAPSPANPGLSPTVLADTEPPKFRPSRPPSSRPPANGGSASPTSPSPTPVSARPTAKASETAPAPIMAVMQTPPPQDAIGTEGVETSRAVQRPGSSAPPIGEASRDRAARITEEYVLGARRDGRELNSSPEPRLPSASSSGRDQGTRSEAPAYAPPIASAAEAARSVSAPAPKPAAVYEVRPDEPMDMPPILGAAPAVPRSAGAKEPLADGGSAPRAAAVAPTERPAPPHGMATDFLAMSLFAVLTVLVGDGLIRVWFGSPYGAPQVQPISAARDSATKR